MSRQVLNAVTTLNLGTQVDPMTLDLYGLLEMFSYQAYTGSVSIPSYTGTNVKFRIDGSNKALAAIGSPALRSWRASVSALQLGTFSVVWEQSNGAANVGFGLYESGTNTFQYTTTGDAPTLYSQISGTHVWYRAAAGTANAAVTLIENGRWDANGNLLVTGGGALGYGVGSGGSITQATSKSTGVTLNKPAGAVVMNAAALGAGASVTFNLTNSFITVNDVLGVNAAGNASYDVRCLSCNNGAAVIRVTNITGGSLSEAVQLNFVLHKGSTT